VSVRLGSPAPLTFEVRMSKLSSKVDERPAMQFYLKDWLADTRILNLAERGLWIDALAFMFRAPRRGYLIMQNGCKPDAEALRNMFGTQNGEAEAVLGRILAKGVASSDEQGVIYCRRMAREADNEERKSEQGRAAAKAKWDAERMRKDGSPTPTPSPTPTATPKEKDRRESPPSEAGRALAGFLQSELTRTLPGIPSSKQTGAELERRLLKWALEFDAFGRIDKVLPDEYRAIITWALADEFWRTNIRSPGSLRTMKHGASAKVWVDFRKPRGGYSGKFSSKP
jgi:uncharacterized protein YdaU (DUF1376 family)